MEVKRLKITGQLQRKLYKDFALSLELDILQDNEIVLFCDYSESDFPIGYTFSIIADKSGEYILSDCPALLRNVSQQLLKPFDYIPIGWKTICKFEFPNGTIPLIVRDLPEIRDWGQVGKYLYFTD